MSKITIEELKKRKPGTTYSTITVSLPSEESHKAPIKSEISPSFSLLLTTTALAISAQSGTPPAEKMSISQILANDNTARIVHVTPAISSVRKEVFYTAFLGQQVAISFEDVFNPNISEQKYEQLAQKLAELYVKESSSVSSCDPHSDAAGVIQIYAKDILGGLSQEAWGELELSISNEASLEQYQWELDGANRRLSLIEAAEEFGKLIPTNLNSLQTKLQYSLASVVVQEKDRQEVIKKVVSICDFLVSELQRASGSMAEYKSFVLSGSRFMVLLLQENLDPSNQSHHENLSVSAFDLATLMAVAQTITAIWQLVREIRKDKIREKAKSRLKREAKSTKPVTYVEDLKISPQILDAYNEHLRKLEVEFCRMVEESIDSKQKVNLVEAKYRRAICEALASLRRLNSGKLPSQPKFFELWSEFQCGAIRRAKGVVHD